MSRVIKIGAAGVISFMTATSISALTTAEAMDEFDLLAISEEPLSETELGEARGGFSFGGFDFKFGVEIAPVTVENPASSNMFGSGGLFGDNGVFDDDGGPIGQNGVFGESGIFGQNNVPSNDEQPSAVDTSPFQASAQAAGFENTMVETVQQPTEVSVQQAAPIVENASATNTVVPVVAPIVVAPAVQGPAQIVADLVDQAIPGVAVAQTAADIIEVASAPEAQPAAIVEAAVSGLQPSTPSQKQSINAQPQPTANAAPVQPTANVQRAVTQRITQTTTMNGRTFVVDNNINGAKFTQTIELNVAIPNFDARINRAIADAAVATIISANYILGQIN